MENEDAYNKLFDTVTGLNNSGKYDIIIGIRDTNWVKPLFGKIPGYQCEIILLDDTTIIYEGSYTSSDAEEVQYSLNLLLEESNDAIVKYIKNKH